MKICIYSGSFNPVHYGHISLANYLITNNISDEVWIVVSPQNPLKMATDLLPDDLRLKMAKLAFKSKKRIKVSDVEFYLPKPNYTIDTLDFLQKKYPNYVFGLLIGEDNVKIFDKWKNFEQILNQYEVLVYPRLKLEQTEINSKENDIKMYPQMKFINAPFINISSTEIRERIKNHQSVKGLLPDNIIKLLTD